MLQRFSSLFLSFFLAIVSYAQETGLGSIHFTTSTKSEKAQEHFITGTLLLHSFEYEDAAEAYRLAQKEDPEMVMAYWGEAMTYNHPIWFQQDREEALSVLLKLGKTATERTAKTPIEMERDWLAAIEVLYGEGDKAVRDERYADYMLNLYQKYPDDNEVAAFCALSILGSSHGGRDEYKYMRSASIVEEVYQKNPDHPGALHYLIHSYDDPVHAPLGMRAAQLYARVAPFAAHALHMPSHIFVAMGMWDEVISSNEHSSAAADARRKRKDLGVDARGYHSLHWLQYGYLQKGRTTDAMRLLIDMEHDFNESKSKRAAFHLAVMRAGYLIETEEWSSAALDIELNHDKLFNKTQALDYLIQGMAAIHNGDLVEAHKVHSNLKQMAPLEVEMQLTSGEVVTCCSPTYAEDDDESEGTKRALYVMNLELEALLALAEGKEQEAIDLLLTASAIEGQMDFMFGPPIIAKPSHELLGEVLLSAGRYNAARKAFKGALKRAPNRSHSIQGLKEAEAGLTMR